MVKTLKTWETVFFQAIKGKDTVEVELSFNRCTKEYTLNTKREEGVSFKGDTPQVSRLKVAALSAAIKYVEKQIKDGQ